MSVYQCWVCGDTFSDAGSLAAHKRHAHLSPAQSARRRVVAAALALTAGIALADCDDPAPAWAECFPSFQSPTPCVGHEDQISTPSTTAPSVVVDVTPPAVMPVSVSVPATLTPDDPPQSSSEVGVAPVPVELPETGGHSLALALVALGFTLVGATLAGPLARRRP